MPQAQQAKLVGVPPFALNRLGKQVGRRSFEALREGLEACVQADFDIKRGAMREEMALDRLMLLLMRGENKK